MTGPRWTPQFREVIQDPNVVEEFDRLASVLNAALAGQTTFDAESGLDTGQTVNTRPISDSGAADFAIRWLKGPWLLNSDGDVGGQAVIRPPQITSNQDNYAPDGIDTAIGLELTSDAARTITGLRIQAQQRRLLFILNRGSFNITFPHNNSGSTASQRFGLGATGESFVLTPGRLVWFFYDVSGQLWRFFALPAVSPGSLPSSLGASWGLIGSVTASGASHDFADLSGYRELLIVMSLVTCDNNSIRQVLVSTDNGGSFSTTSGDYVVLSGAGAVTNVTYLGFDTGNDTIAHSGWMMISLFNTVYPKPVTCAVPQSNLTSQLVTPATACNAIRIRPSGGNNFNGGTFYVFGR